MPRKHNFSAGPAALPLEVIQELQEALPEFSSCQAGIMEISHRSKEFGEVLSSAKNRFRTLLGIPDDYHILFLQGGASLQFYMLPLNILLPHEAGGYIMTGTWSTKALKESKRCSQSFALWEDETHTSVAADIPSSQAKFIHYTSNNTIYGTQFSHTPKSNLPLVVDMSSDICSRTINVADFDIIYAGAQKNLGPSGVTAVILSDWAVEQSKKSNNERSGGLPSMLNYALMVEKDSMFNTPNTFGIYALDKMFAWMEAQGGLEAISKRNETKSSLIYDELDSSDFWVPHARKDSRSQMNITWRIQNQDLEKIFLQEAAEEGLLALKGHRSVGGIRASLYNACSIESAQILASFMKSFRERY